MFERPHQHFCTPKMERWLWLLLVPALFVSRPAFAASLTITSPTPNQSVSGSWNFAASGSGVASVQFDIGSLRLGTATSAPFAVTWNTGYAGDGNYEVEAYAYDASGALVGSA